MIEVEHHGDILLVQLAVPHRRNALSRGLIENLAEHFTGTADARVTILTGQADYFSAGADLGDLHGTDADVAYDAAIAELRRAIESHAHPTVAAINGYCLGAAVDVVTAFDLVIANRAATFAVPATRLGLLYDPAAIGRMASRVHIGGLTRLLLTGDTIDAQVAHDAGLVDIVAERPADQEALELAARMSANDPDAIDATVQVLRDIRHQRLDPAAWNTRRLDLMNSPSRSRALAAARRPKRVAP